MSISTNIHKSSEVAYLENKFQDVKDEQGIFGKSWNGVKEIFNVGASESKCESMLEQYKSGRISFEEAVEYIERFEQKQDNITELGKNILTGVGAIVVATTAVAGGTIFWPAAIAFGAPTGAAIKTALGIADRATNKKSGDGLARKEIVKDAVSGAVTGATSAISSNVGAGIRNGNIKTSIINGAKCGLTCGAISGSTSYLTDVELEEDKEFNLADMLNATVSSSLVSGGVGAVVGAGMYGSASVKGNVGKTVSKSLEETIAQDSTTSSIRKLLGRNVKDIAASIA